MNAKILKVFLLGIASGAALGVLHSVLKAYGVPEFFAISISLGLVNLVAMPFYLRSLRLERGGEFK